MPLGLEIKKKFATHYIIALVTVVIGVFLDQLTKSMAASKLTLGNPVEVIPGFLNINLVRNTGAAFGIGAQWPEIWRNVVFLGLTGIAIIFIIYLLLRSIGESKLLVISLSLILAGALGNFYNRIMHRNVVDFIEVYYKELHWPNFNIADSIICIGVGLYLIYSLTSGKKTSKEAPPPQPPV